MEIRLRHRRLQPEAGPAIIAVAHEMMWHDVPVRVAASRRSTAVAHEIRRAPVELHALVKRGERVGRIEATDRAGIVKRQAPALSARIRGRRGTGLRLDAHADA